MTTTPRFGIGGSDMSRRQTANTTNNPARLHQVNAI